MDKIVYTVVKNKQMKKYCSRDDFVCLEINIPSDSKFYDRVKMYAERITPLLNKGQANTSEKRDNKIVEIDNLSGLIAELACEVVFKWMYGEDQFVKPDNTNSKNQVDLTTKDGKTIEIRSSCVRNGIDFAIFTPNKRDGNDSYFDVIGPYSNGYKKTEIVKDYYVRVLYECNKNDFMNLFSKDYLQLYITGGATRRMMHDRSKYKIKHLIPNGEDVRVESDYKVIPLSKSLDIIEFFDVMESENPELNKKRELKRRNRNG